VSACMPLLAVLHLEVGYCGGLFGAWCFLLALYAVYAISLHRSGGVFFLHCWSRSFTGANIPRATAFCLPCMPLDCYLLPPSRLPTFSGVLYIYPLAYIQDLLFRSLEGLELGAFCIPVYLLSPLHLLTTSYCGVVPST
jgi:hypothetical protein